MSHNPLNPSISENPLSKSSSNNSNFTQVAPQDPIKVSAKKKAKASKPSVDPEYVKSPPPAGASAGRPASKASSLKASFGSKSGFLSLLLCCTVGGAGAFLDNGDRASVAGSRSGRSDARVSRAKDSSIKTAEKHAPIPLQDKREGLNLSTPMIITNPTELNALTSPTPDSSPDTEYTSATPSSIPLQSPDGGFTCLLPPLASEHSERKCLVLDLDETLVHSSFTSIPNPDFIVKVEIDNKLHDVYVLKRPGVDEFMRKMGEKYEIVVFTASLSKYADPVLDMLDIHKVVDHRLFREACYYHMGSYVKDLSQLGRNLATTLILDNSPASYIFHTSNAVPVSSWFNDPHDTELTDLVAFLEDLTEVDDVTLVLDSTLPNEDMV